MRTIECVPLDNLPDALLKAREVRDLSVRAAAVEAKVSPATFNRVERGNPCEAGIYIALSAWVLKAAA